MKPMTSKKLLSIFLLSFSLISATGFSSVAYIINTDFSNNETEVINKVKEKETLKTSTNFQINNQQHNKFHFNNFTAKKSKKIDFSYDNKHSLSEYKSPNPVALDYIKSNSGNLTKKDLNHIGRIYNLPENLLYAIMMKESKGNSYAISYKQAKGAFQFMYPTALEFGLVNGNIDYRNDPWRSADAAARYIKWLFENLTPEKNNKEYESYKYTLAAYNAGIGRVIGRGGDVSVPNIKETMDYVSKIVGYLEGRKYLVQRGDRIKEIAKNMGVSREQIVRLNRGISNKNLRYGKFISIKPHSNRYYEVQKGDTLSRISELTNTDLYTIRKRNGIKGDTIYAGQKIQLK